MQLRDCTWCGSARSIEHDICQVCLMRFPELEDLDDVVVILEDRDLEVRETPAKEEATGTAVAE